MNKSFFPLLPPLPNEGRQTVEGVVSSALGEMELLRRYQANREKGTAMMMVRKICDVNHRVGTSILGTFGTSDNNSQTNFRDYRRDCGMCIMFRGLSIALPCITTS